MKRIMYLLLSLLLIFMIPLNAIAASQGACSIEIRMEHKNTKINGGELIAVRVGYVDEQHEMFRQISDHTEIKNIGKQSAVTQMLKYYNAEKSKYAFDSYKADVKNGLALFEGIPTGLYLVYQEKAASGYNNLAPFLVTVPYNGETDVSVTSKTELEKEPNNPTEPTKKPTSPTTGNKLPQTGQLSWPIPWMACGGMSLFALGWWLCFGDRKDSYET